MMADFKIMRLFVLILAFLLLVFQYNFWFGKNGYWEYQHTEKEIAARQQENKQLAQRNQLIAAEIKDLSEGVEAVEERARMQYEMIDPDETFYRIVKED